MASRSNSLKKFRWNNFHLRLEVSIQFKLNFSVFVLPSLRGHFLANFTIVFIAVQYWLQKNMQKCCLMLSMMKFTSAKYRVHNITDIMSLSIKLIWNQFVLLFVYCDHSNVFDWQLITTNDVVQIFMSPSLIA